MNLADPFLLKITKLIVLSTFLRTHLEAFTLGELAPSTGLLSTSQLRCKCPSARASFGCYTSFSFQEHQKTCNCRLLASHEIQSCQGFPAAFVHRKLLKARPLTALPNQSFPTSTLCQRTYCLFLRLLTLFPRDIPSWNKKRRS